MLSVCCTIVTCKSVCAAEGVSVPEGYVRVNNERDLSTLCSDISSQSLLHLIITDMDQSPGGPTEISTFLCSGTKN